MFNNLPLIVPPAPIDTRRLLARLTDGTVLKGVYNLPQFAGFAGLAVLLLAMSATWWRERNGRGPKTGSISLDGTAPPQALP